LLAQLSPQLAGPLPRGNDAPLAWMLMIEEARQQGLYGSSARSQQWLGDLRITNERLAELKLEFNATDAFIYQVLRHWPYCTGMKTGYTNAAGKCLVSSASGNGRTVFAVILGSKTPTIWQESQELLSYGLGL